MLLQEVSSAAKAGSTRKRMVARERHALLALLDQARVSACLKACPPADRTHSDSRALSWAAGGAGGAGQRGCVPNAAASTQRV